jgi:membrane-bound lytic murein transglycosylase A
MEVEAKPSVPWTSAGRPGALANQGQAVSYYTRREIDGEGSYGGAGWNSSGCAIPWMVSSCTQGSGQIRLPDGQVRRVHYAASNGHPYYSIGRVLLDEGRLPRDAMSSGLTSLFS